MLCAYGVNYNWSVEEGFGLGLNPEYVSAKGEPKGNSPERIQENVVETL